MSEATTYPKASEAALALINDGFVFAPSTPTPPINLPGVTTISYPWCSKSGYLSARIVRVRSRCYRIEVVA